MLESLGDVAHDRGLLRDPLDAWAEAASLIDPGSVPLRVAELHRKIGSARWIAGETDEALMQLGKALAVLAGDLETPPAARAYQQLGRIHARLGDQLSAEQWTERALSLGTALAAADVIAHASITMGLILARTVTTWPPGDRVTSKWRNSGAWRVTG
jgi:tetratricopeptide (TPR) repeat protein